MLLSTNERYLILQYVLIYAGGNSKKTDRMLELQQMLSAQVDDLKTRKRKGEKSCTGRNG